MIGSKLKRRFLQSGALEHYWWLKLKLGYEPGFFPRWKQWAEWLSELDRAARIPLSGRRILAFSTTYGWLDFGMAMATVVAGYGAQVDYVWLPYDEWGPTPRHWELSRYEKWARRHRAPLVSERVKVINLLDVPLAPVEPWMREQASQLSHLDTQYQTKTEEVDHSNPKHEEIYQHRLERNILCMQGLTTLVAGQAYQKIIVANGQVMELGACYRTARQHGIKCVTYEVFERKGFMGFNDTIPASNSDTQEAWEKDAPHILDGPRQQRVAALLSGREGTDWEDYCVSAQSQKKLGESVLREKLGISAGKKVALCCPNVGWDSSVLGVGRAFSTMASWLRFVAQYFQDTKDWVLIIRCHPGERTWGTNQSSESIVKSLYSGELPPSVRLIPAEDPTNTYGLMDFSDLGLVFTSTTGLEMACRGIPVITAGWVHYGQKGFTADPSTLEEFVSTLNRHLSEIAPLDPEKRELSYSYLDVYFNQWPRPYPWHTTFRQDIKAWPISRVLSPEGQTLFGSTFEFLAG